MMEGEGREGRAVITAKPLRRKDLGHPTLPDEGDNLTPTLVQHDSNLTPTRHQQDRRSKDESTKLKTLDSKSTYKIIFYIIRDTPGISHMEIYHLVKKFCRKQHFKEYTTHAHYRNFLNKLIQEGKIDSVVIENTQRYFVHIKGVEQWQKAV